MSLHLPFFGMDQKCHYSWILLPDKQKLTSEKWKLVLIQIVRVEQLDKPGEEKLRA